MTLALLVDPTGAIVAPRRRSPISEKLTDEDYKGTLIPRLSDAVAAGDKVKALLYFDETFDGWEAAAAARARH
jgi:hypothetical protein